MNANVDEIKNIVVPIAEEHGIRRISLFGSRARGDSTEKSDYDFVISKGRITGFISYMAFIHALEDALGAHVDVVTDTSEDDNLLNSIKEEEILLYEQL